MLGKRSENYFGHKATENHFKLVKVWAPQDNPELELAGYTELNGAILTSSLHTF